MNEDVKKQLQAQIDADFHQLEAAASSGVIDILRAYGSAEESMREAEAYLAAMDPQPLIFTTSNGAG